MVRQLLLHFYCCYCNMDDKSCDGKNEEDEKSTEKPQISIGIYSVDNLINYMAL